jgi:hypothetical protein
MPRGPNFQASATKAPSTSIPVATSYKRPQPSWSLSAKTEAVFAWPLARADQIRQRQHGWKLYSFHAPEGECIGKGMASAPYEFGVKACACPTVDSLSA